jgi:CBS domain-containing protein
MKKMKVKDVMKTDVGFCSAEDSLMKAADVMRGRDCGAIPIVDENKRVVGILTDRDLCLAVVARNRKASDVKTGELINGKLVVCAAEDKLEDALRKMRKYQIKRLVAVNNDGELVGILSLGDVLLSIGKDKDLKKEVYSTLKAIYKPKPILLREIDEKEN